MAAAQLAAARLCGRVARRARQRRAVGVGDERDPGADRGRSTRRGWWACSSRAASRCPASASCSAAWSPTLFDPRVTFLVAGAGVLVGGGASPRRCCADRVARRRRARDDPLAAAAESPLAGQAVRPRAASDVVEASAMPPTSRPLPRFVAEPPHELEPYGRWRERSSSGSGRPARRSRATSSWGPPARSSGSRSAPTAAAPTCPRRVPTGGRLRAVRLRLLHPLGLRSPEPGDFLVQVGLHGRDGGAQPGLEDRPQRRGDRPWRGPGRRGGDLTLVWGTPLVPGGRVATAELEGETRRPVRARSERRLHAGRARRRQGLRRRRSTWSQALEQERRPAGDRDPLRSASE